MPSGPSEHARIELQIRAVEIAYRDPMRSDDPEQALALRERSRHLLDPLKREVVPFPDLQIRWAEAWTRLELEPLPDRHPPSGSAWLSRWP